MTRLLGGRLALSLGLGLGLGVGIVVAQAQAEDISPACGDYQPNTIIIDGYVRTPTTLGHEQLAALPGQQTINISFLDRLGQVQHHSETGPLLWTVLTIGAGGVATPPLYPEQYQGPNALIPLYVVLVAANGYQSVVSEAEIDPAYANQPIMLALAEDGQPMSDAPYSTTNKAPAQLVVPGDVHGGRYANRICRIKVVDGAIGPEG